METKYLIIGSGVAALQAAKGIRKKDPDSTITLVSKEEHLPYFRVRLTEAIASGASLEDLLVEESSFYEKNRIRILLRTAVTQVDYEKKEATLAGGDCIQYEKLLLAVGSQPFIPPYEGRHKENVFSVRTYRDIERLREKLDSMRRILVVGGGLLGLEAAHSLLQKGLEVHVCDFGPRLLGKQVNEKISARLQADLEKEGLLIHTGATLKEVVGFNQVERVILTDDESFDCDGVLFSVGVRAQTDLAEGLDINRGICTNEKLETTHADVWAAGDCAEVNGNSYGLWTASMQMGKIAGENMTGGAECFSNPQLFTKLEIGKVKIFSAGSYEGDEAWEETVDGTQVQIFYREGTIIGGILYGSTAKMSKVRKLIRTQTPQNELKELFL